MGSNCTATVGPQYVCYSVCEEVALADSALSLSMGKTTLLLHIAERKLAIPPNIDVLYCEQGTSWNGSEKASYL